MAIGLNGYWPNWKLDQVALDEMALDEMGLDEVAIDRKCIAQEFQRLIPITTNANYTIKYVRNDK